MVCASAGCGGSHVVAPDAGGDSTRIRYCATGLACGLIPPRGFGDCASHDDGPPLDMERCIAAAGADCDAAQACTYDASHLSLCTFGGMPRCDGDVALTCDGKTSSTVESDCARVGQRCVVGPTAALCAPARCDRGDHASYCDGAVAGYCARPFLIGEDCASRGATCQPSDGGASCVGEGGACIVSSCEGQTLVACLGRRRATTVCPDGTRCVPQSDEVAVPFCGLGALCDPTTWFDRCVGGVLTYCRRGLIETIDCRAAGFLDCVGSPASGCTVVPGRDGGGPPLLDMPLP